jgi:hypothetical protein
VQLAIMGFPRPAFGLGVRISEAASAHAPECKLSIPIERAVGICHHAEPTGHQGFRASPVANEPLIEPHRVIRRRRGGRPGSGRRRSSRLHGLRGGRAPEVGDCLVNPYLPAAGHDAIGHRKRL